MRLALTVVSPGAKRAADVVLEAGPATPVVRIAAELGRLMGNDWTVQGAPPSGNGGRPGASVLGSPGLRSHGSLALVPADPDGPSAIPLYVAGQRVPQQLSLLESRIRYGAVVSLGGPEGCAGPEPGGLVEIRVMSGPGAGSIYWLPAGQADIGSGDTADVRIWDEAMAPLALRIFVDGRGDCQVAAYEGVRAAVDREPLAAAAQWQPGQVITIGRSLLGLARYQPPDAALHPSADGLGLDFNRSPRLLPPARQTRFQLPAPPPEAERRPLPVLMAAVPLILGLAMAYFLHQVYLLAVAGLTPVMLLGSQLSERRQSRKAAARRAAAYRGHKARVERDAGEALEAERAERAVQFPDPATVLSIAAGPRRRLWERRRSDPDYLVLRVGTADLPSSVELTDPERDEHRRQVIWRLPDAPVTISLPRRGVIGLAGPGDTPRAAGRWLVAQAAALHSPNDLRVYLLTDSSGRVSWEWARWLPHCRPQSGQDCAMLIGNDAESVATRIAELLAIVSARQQAAAGAGHLDLNPLDGRTADALRTIQATFPPALRGAASAAETLQAAASSWADQLSGFQSEADVLERQAAAATAHQQALQAQQAAMPPGSVVLTDDLRTAAATVTVLHGRAQELHERYLAAAGKAAAGVDEHKSLWEDAEPVRKVLEFVLAPLDIVAADHWVSALKEVAGVPSDWVAEVDEKITEATKLTRAGKSPIEALIEGGYLAESTGQKIDAWYAFAPGWLKAAAGSIAEIKGVSTTLSGLGLAADVGTIISPQNQGAMGWVDRSAALLNGGLITADLVMTTLPGIGEVALAATGAYLALDWTYQHWTPFRDVANDIGHATVRAADDVGHGAAKAADAAGHLASSEWHAVTSDFSLGGLF